MSKSKYTSFLEPVNLEFRLAVFNFFQYSVSFVLDFVKNLRASMSISAGMFETLFNFYSSVCLRLNQVKAFFLLLQHRKIAKAKKQTFFKLNNCRKNFSIACAEQQSFITLNSCNFACKHTKITEILSF